MLAILLVLPMNSALAKIFPVMVVLGPLIGLQYLYWRRYYGPERTMRQYLLAEPMGTEVTVQSMAVG